MSTQEKTRIASSVSPSEAQTGKKSAGKSGGDESKGAKKSMKLKIAIAVVLLLVAGAAAKFTLLAPSKASAATTAKTPPKPALGPVVPMDEMTLNLDGGHFLRLKLAIQTSKGTSDTLDLTEGVQATIDEFSNKPVAELTGTKARTKAKNELVAKLQVLYPKKIVDIFYTEFVMQ